MNQHSEENVSPLNTWTRLSEDEREAKRKQLWAIRERKLLEGEPVGRIALGYRVVRDESGSRIAKDPVMQDFIRQARELYTQGYSVRTVRSIMTHRGMVNKHGKPLGVKAVWAIFCHA